MSDIQNENDINKIPEDGTEQAPGASRSAGSAHGQPQELISEEPISTEPAVQQVLTEQSEHPGHNVTSRAFWSEVFSDKKLILTLGGVGALALLAGGVIYLIVFGSKPAPPAPEVALLVETPSRIVSGEEFEMTINYSNRSSETLKNLTMTLGFPTDYSFREADPRPENSDGNTYKLADLGAGQANKVNIKGVLEGEIGDTKQLDIKISYKLQKVSATYTTENTVDLEIGAPDLVLVLNGPDETISGQETIYNLTYRNISDDILRGVTVTAVLPEEFKTTEIQPPFTDSAQKTWTLGDLLPAREGSLRFKGAFGEVVGKDRAIEVIARSSDNPEKIISRAFLVTTVDSSPLVVNLSLDGYQDGVASLGDTLNYHITIENKGDTALTNLIVSAELTGAVYDFSTLQTTGGVWADRIITWTSGGVEALKLLRSQNKVTIDFNIKLQDPATYFGPPPANISVTSKASSFELRQPLISNEISLRVRQPFTP